MVTQATYNRIVELMPKPRQGNVIQCLDVGCEDYHFHLEGYHVARCDIKPQDLPNFKIVDLNKRWDYPDESFHVIRACEVIEHLENPWHFFREAKRVLKPDGVLVLSTPNPLSPASRRLFFETGYFHWFHPHNIEHQAGEHITPIFLWQIRHICKKLGLVLETIRFDDEDPLSPSYQAILIVRVRKPKNV